MTARSLVEDQQRFGRIFLCRL